MDVHDRLRMDPLQAGALAQVRGRQLAVAAAGDHLQRVLRRVGVGRARTGARCRRGSGRRRASRACSARARPCRTAVAKPFSSYFRQRRPGEEVVRLAVRPLLVRLARTARGRCRASPRASPATRPGRAGAGRGRPTARSRCGARRAARRTSAPTTKKLPIPQWERDVGALEEVGRRQHVVGELRRRRLPEVHHDEQLEVRARERLVGLAARRPSSAAARRSGRSRRGPGTGPGRGWRRRWPAGSRRACRRSRCDPSDTPWPSPRGTPCSR